MDSFQQLFCVINGWNPNFKKEFKKYSFGSDNGINCLIEQFSGHNLGQYFNSIECCLMPSSGLNPYNNDFNFNEMKADFNTELSNLIKTNLLDFNQMQRKTYPKSNEFMKIRDLLPLFKSYINRLNGESLAIDFGMSSGVADPDILSVEESELSFGSTSLTIGDNFSSEGLNKINENLMKMTEAIDNFRLIGEKLTNEMINLNRTTMVALNNYNQNSAITLRQELRVLYKEITKKVQQSQFECTSNRDNLEKIFKEPLVITNKLLIDSKTDMKSLENQILTLEKLKLDFRVINIFK